MSLSKYDYKDVHIVTEDGTEFSGRAEVFPSGYGLHEFDREEESICIDDVFIFKSDIAKIELLSEDDNMSLESPERYYELIEELIEGQYWIIDILPKQVPAESAGQYFAVERYFLQPERKAMIYRKYAEILLRLNCYYDMAVSFDSCESWEQNPDPESFCKEFTKGRETDLIRVIFEAQNVMIDLECYDTYMTVYDPEGNLIDMLQQLAAAEGLFVWQPEE